AVKTQVTPDQDFDRKLQACWTTFKNNPAEGARAAASLLSQYPNRWESYGIAGKILRSQSQLAKARYAYQKALGLAPDNVKPQLVAVIQQIDSEAKGAIGR